MRFPALLAPVLFTTLVFAAQSSADEVDLGPPIPHSRLDALRGGFNLPTGISVAFGFERTVTVNGQVVVSQTLNIADLSKITTDQASQLAALTQSKTVQIGTPVSPAATTGTVSTPTATITNTPTTSSVTTPTATLTTTPSTASVTAPGVGTVATPTPTVDTSTITTPIETPALATVTPPPVTTPTVAPTLVPTETPTITPNAGVALVPNVNTAITPGLNNLIIQNSLDGQSIQAMTTIHAATNALNLLQDIHFTQSLGDSLRLGGTP